MDSWAKQKALDTLSLLTLAVTNWRLYPPQNPIVSNAIGTLHTSLTALFQKEPSLVFSEADKNLLIYNERISLKDQRQPKIAALLELLINFEIRSVNINAGVTKKDLSGFVDILSQQPDTIKLSGGISKVLGQRNIDHIILGQQVYIAKSSKQKLLASLDIHDDEIINYIAGANPQLDLDVDQVREMAQNTEWMEQIFKNGMNQIKSERYLPSVSMSESLVRMMSRLDGIVDPADQEKFSRMIAKSIAELEEDMIGHILSQDIEQYFNGKLLQDVLDELEGAKLDRVMDIVYSKLKDGKSLPGKDAGSLLPSRNVEALPGKNAGAPFPPRGGQASPGLPEGNMGKILQQLKEAEKRSREHKISELKKELAPLLTGGEEGILNPSLMESLPGIVNELIAHEQHETVEAIIKRLAEALLSERQDIRDNASAALAKVIEGLPEKRQPEVVEQLSITLTRWIQLEVSATEAYNKLSSLLKDHMIKLIQEKRFGECLPLLNVYHLIDYGLLEKNELIQKTAADIIHALSSSYRLDFLFGAYVNSSDQEKVDIGRILSRLGDTSLHRLMDLLRDQPVSDERVKILHLIQEIGPAALPVIKERSLRDFPWFHHRNLAYLLRFIKTDATVDVLQTLLRHNHQKVRQDALESLYIIGENERGPALLPLLSSGDDSFKLSIIEMLGKIRYKGAAPVLIEMLKDRPFMASSARKEMEEAICIALGKIGTPEAAALLTEISKQKFYNITAYPDRVRKAAAMALLSINNP